MEMPIKEYIKKNYIPKGFLYYKREECLRLAQQLFDRKNFDSMIPVYMKKIEFIDELLEEYNRLNNIKIKKIIEIKE